MTKANKLILMILPLIAALGFAGFLYLKHTKEVARYDFALQSDQGEVRLADFRGKKTLVYFGYGLCPDICPTTLTAIAQALNKLTPMELDGVRVVFISVDPDRDKPKDLGIFARYFHPNIIGATADESYIAALAKNYGVSYQKVPQPNSSIGYSVGHSADVYVIGKSGKLEATLPFGVSPEEIIKAIQK
jgi:protein SCO1/2